MVGSFKLGTWLGFPIRIHLSWFIVAALVIWTFSTLEFPRRLPGLERGAYVGMGSAAALLFFLSVLIHELAHAVVGRTRGVEVEAITLFVFGGIAQARAEARRPLDEFLLTAAGPLSSLALCGAFWGLARAAQAAGLPPAVVQVLSFLALLNLALAVFNLIPGFPLDGGRILRSVIWAVTGDAMVATRWATGAGRLFGALLIGLGAAQVYYGFLIGGMWSVLIGWFLYQAAATSHRHFGFRHHLSRIAVERVMDRAPVTVGPDVPVVSLIRDHLARRPLTGVPVVLGDAVLGVVDLDDVAAVPAEERAAMTAAQVMRPTHDVTVVEPGETLDRLLSVPHGATVLVMQGGRLAGTISVGDFSAWAASLIQLDLADSNGSGPHV